MTIPFRRRSVVPRGLAIAMLQAISTSCPGVAAAEDAEAESLFGRGVREMAAEHYDVACPALRESHRLEPKLGTLFTLAECLSKWGKLARALETYERYAALVSQAPPAERTRHQGRLAIAEQAIVRLGGKVAVLDLLLPNPLVAGTVVTLDGAQLDAATLDRPLRVDPGAHSIELRRAGEPGSRVDATVAAGEIRQLSLELAASPPPAEDPAPGPAAANPSVAPAESGRSAGAEQAPSTPDRPVDDGLQTSIRLRRTLGWGALGLSAVGVAVGAITGTFVLAKKSRVEDECDAQRNCSYAGLNELDSARSLAPIANVGFGVGIAAGAAGALLLLTLPSSAPASGARSRWKPLLVGAQGGGWAGVERTW